jgi:hypothetical protein
MFTVLVWQTFFTVPDPAAAPRTFRVPSAWTSHWIRFHRGSKLVTPAVWNQGASAAGFGYLARVEDIAWEMLDIRQILQGPYRSAL